MDIVVVDYQSGLVLRRATQDDLDRAREIRSETGAFSDEQGETVYLQGVDFDYDEDRYVGVPNTTPKHRGGTLADAARHHSLNVYQIENPPFISGDDISGDQYSDSDLRGIDMRWVTAREALFDEARLSGANLTEADLAGAWMRAADLRSAWLHETNLRGANLIYADLRGALLHECDLTGTKFRGARRDPNDHPIPGWEVVDGRLVREAIDMGEMNG